MKTIDPEKNHLIHENQEICVVRKSNYNNSLIII